MDYALALAVYIYRLPVTAITHLFFSFSFLHLSFLLQSKLVRGASQSTQTTAASYMIL